MIFELLEILIFLYTFNQFFPAFDFRVSILFHQPLDSQSECFFSTGFFRFKWTDFARTVDFFGTFRIIIRTLYFSILGLQFFEPLRLFHFLIECLLYQ